MQRALLRDRAEREPLSKESVFLPLRLHLCVWGGLSVCCPSEEFRCSPQAAAASPRLTSPRTAELSGLCAPLWEVTLGGRGWSTWLLLFAEKLLEWVRQKGRLFLLQPWGSAVQSRAFLACSLFFTCQRTQVINPKEIKSHRDK